MHFDLKMKQHHAASGGSGGAGSGKGSMEGSLAAVAAHLAELKLDQLNAQTLHLLRRLKRSAPREVCDYILGTDSGIKVNDRVQQSLMSALERSPSHAGDTIEFLREVAELFSDQRCTQSSWEEIVTLALAVSDTTIRYSPDSERIRNDRHERSDLTGLILRAVKVEEPGRLLDALRTMATYDGAIKILADFLLKAGSDNPYRATREFEYRIHSFRDLPEGRVKWEGRGKKRRPAVCNGDTGRYFVDSGDVHCAYNPLNVGSMFITKRQAMLSIYSNWRPESFSPKQADSRSKRRDKEQVGAVRAVNAGEFDSTELSDLVDRLEYEQFGLERLEGVSLEELADNPLYQKIAQRSPFLARDLDLYMELQAAIRTLKGDLHRITRGPGLLKVVDKTHRILNTPGGDFLARIKSRIEAGTRSGPPVPEHIKLGYYRITNENTDLTPKQERFLLQGLLAWDALNSNMTRETAFGGVLADVAVYEELSQIKTEITDPNHPIHDQTHHFEAFLQDHQDILRHQEVKYPDVVQFTEDLGVFPWREAMNRYLFQRYEQAFNTALDQLRWMFQSEVSLQNGATGSTWMWKGHSRGGSVPRTELLKTVYGVPVGRTGRRSRGRPAAALYGPDFRHVMNGLSLREFNRQDNDRTFFTALPIGRFEELVIGVVKAGRKAEAFDLAYERDGRTQKLELIREDVGDTFSDWSPRLVTGGSSNETRLLPAEELFLSFQEERDSDSAVTEFRELVRRAEARFSDDGQGWRYHPISGRRAWETLVNRGLLLSAEVGLYQDRIETDYHDEEPVYRSGRETSVLRKLHRDLSTLIPITDEIEAKIVIAGDIIASPLVQVEGIDESAVKVAVRQLIRSKKEGAEWYQVGGYLTPTELEEIKALQPFRDLFTERKLCATGGHRAKLEELAKRVLEWKRLWLYSVRELATGGLELLPSRVRDSELGKQKISFDREEDSTQKITVTYYDPTVLEKAVKELKGSYRSVTGRSLPRGWLETAEREIAYHKETPHSLDLRALLTAQHARLHREMIETVSERIPSAHPPSSTS